MKTHTTLTIDIEVLERAKTLNLNISSTFNDFLANLVKQHTKDIAGINIELEKISKEKIIKRINNLKTELDLTLRNIEIWEEAQKKQQEKQLIQEKEDIERLKTCVNCGLDIVEGTKKHPFPSGVVCNACYLTADGDSYKKWNTIK